MPSTHQYAGITAGYIAVKRDAEIRSFAEAQDFFVREFGVGRAHVGDEVVIAKRSKTLNLVVVKMAANRPIQLGVKLYDTVIVAYREDETFTTNSGGYVTPTTCGRITQFTPKWARAWSSERNLVLGGFYGDKHANRFPVQRGDAPPIVGPLTPFPKMKRARSKTPYGTLRWLADDDGHIFSLNSRYPKEFVYPRLEYERIGQDGNYNKPLEYTLIRDVRKDHDMRGTRGVAKADVPLDLVNVHRATWGMPLIEVTE